VSATAKARAKNAASPLAPPLSSLRETERHQILQALTEAESVQVKAAAVLGITPRQLAYRLRRHQIVRSFQPVK
jgi:transcriptional regulator with GAF, ATPase, and Fis domain